MSFFSRLTDIVTCNLTAILEKEKDPCAAIEKIVGEMEEGLAGARRSVATAEASVDRLSSEIDELGAQAQHWVKAAKSALGAGDEEEAKLALLRKQEVEDVIEGLKQQHHAAISTRDHLKTTLRALEGRLAEARRKGEQFQAGGRTSATAALDSVRFTAAAPLDENRSRKLESELEALKRELGKS